MMTDEVLEIHMRDVQACKLSSCADMMNYDQYDQRWIWFSNLIEMNACLISPSSYICEKLA